MRAILHHPDTTVLGAAAALLAMIFACGLLAPPMFGLLLAACVIAGIAFLALLFPIPFCVVWLLVTGMSLEMAFADLIGDSAYQPTIAVIKGIEIGLGLLCIVRCGARWDPLCPAWAFLVMLVTGLAHGLYPGLHTTDSLRSAVGSIAPFVFCFARVPRSWAEAIIRTTKWCPVVAVVACLPLAASGIRPLFVESGGARLAGLGHPAFLANVCLPAIYACLIQLYREGRRGDLALLIANGLILVLTGARAPLFFAVAVTGITLASIRSTIFTARDRLMLVLSALALLPILLLLAGALGDVRLFKVVIEETANLSGRDLLWPSFEDAAARSPWFGWGVGAGNMVIPPESEIAQELHTLAAHNEYLRINVEGGLFGRTLLIAMFAGWVIVHTRVLRSSDRRIMRLAFLALAGHAVTDNILISTPACVMFAFVAAIFARTENAATNQPRMALPDSRLVA
jgi:O-antigen ligase